jgi:hypothetical protein
MLRFLTCVQEDASDAFDYTDACYPGDDSDRPIAGRLSKLIQWGACDLERFDRICDIILNRIRHDIRAQNYPSLSVSLQILAELLASVPDLNLSLSRMLTDAIVLLIRSAHSKLIELAIDMTDPIARHSDRLALKRCVQRIVTASLSLCACDDLMTVGFQSLSLLIAKVPMDWLPVGEILATAYPELSINSNARLVVFTIGEMATPMTLPLLCDSLAVHLDIVRGWDDLQSIQDLLGALLSRMRTDFKGAFLRLWLQQVVSGREDLLRDCTILSAAANMVEITPLPRSCRKDLLGITAELALELPKALPLRAGIVEKVATLRSSTRRSRPNGHAAARSY